MKKKGRRRNSSTCCFPFTALLNSHLNLLDLPLDLSSFPLDCSGLELSLSSLALENRLESAPESFLSFLCSEFTLSVFLPLIHFSPCFFSFILPSSDFYSQPLDPSPQDGQILTLHFEIQIPLLARAVRAR